MRRRWPVRRKRDGRRSDRGARPAPARVSAVELCDLCAAVLPAEDAVRCRVPDSSYAHPAADWLDGLRPLTACRPEHLVVLREKYRLRPFVEEELWAAKIARALGTGPWGLGLEELACRTGLHLPELRRAVAWHNERLRRTRRPGPAS